MGRYWSEQSNARQVYGGYITIRIRATHLSTNRTMAHKHSVHEWRYYVCLLILNTNVVYLYPTQRVAEGIMFLTRPTVSQSVIQSVRQSCFSC